MSIFIYLESVGVLPEGTFSLSVSLIKEKTLKRLDIVQTRELAHLLQQSNPALEI